MIAVQRMGRFFTTLILPLICFVLLFFSCKKDRETTNELSSKLALTSKIDAGELLLDVNQHTLEYVFNFEKGAVNVPVKDILKITSDLAHWRTKLSFSDGSEVEVPTKGTSLDFIVENIKLDPSGYNPLSAMVNVWLPTYGRVRVTVHGKHGKLGAITHLCNDDTPRQNVPILGLYADYDNVVDLAFTDREGNERGSTTIHIITQALTVQDFPQWKIVKGQTEKMEPGINLVSYPGQSELDTSLPYMIDNEGELRWLLLLKKSPDLQKFSGSIGLKRTKKGTFISGDQSQQRVVEIDLFGNLINQWDLGKLGYGFHHEVSEAANGNFLINVTKVAARLTNGEPRINDFIIELNPQTGVLVNEWDLAKQLDTTRYIKPDGITPPAFSQSPNNWAHNNSITEIGEDLLATARYQGIFSFNHSGVTQWIISPHKNWGAKYQTLLLKPIAEDGTAITDPAVINGDAAVAGFDWPWGPHTPVALSKDRILVFDNGYNRQWKSNFAPGVKSFSRVVEYKVDLTNRTVQQVWSYGKDRGTQGFSQAISGVQYLGQTGHVLFCPGMGVATSIGSGGRVVEIDPKTKEVIFDLEVATGSGTAFHRVTRMPLYPENL
ncbi:aryl-sulfate sulfotransferase [Sphingobacterium sp.]|uniref:aryl-sulfate sulfotransferase n=1 Tax=Sphingobacterium sp. TaxID=341027 RepID=UPI002589409E|nr:aryl-sulfate sulfotransferase [Sphingobacterium sp.]WET71374.1 MAG: aryl-sulfate sulfotransferase [Sphingobacterium sp.]